MQALAEIWEFTRTDLLRLVRSGKGLVLLMLYGLVEASGGILFALVSKTQLGQLLGGGVLSALASGGDEALAKMLQTVPVPILFAYWFTLLVVPLLVLVMGFDQIAGELSTRSVRYLAFRSRRASWAIGKALAQTIALFGLSLAANVVVLAFSLFTVPNIDLGAAVTWLLVLWLYTAVYGMAYVALVTLVSSLFRTPFLSLAAGAIGLVVLGMVGLLARWVDAIEPLKYALPGTYSGLLLSARPEVTLGAVAALLAFTAAFLGGSVAVLRARDL